MEQPPEETTPRSDATRPDANEPVIAEPATTEPVTTGPITTEPVTTEPITTGHPAVDEVLRSLDGLESAPVDDHVAVFESAHEQLRRTLNDTGDEPA